jgi:hypothetical protein
LYRGFGSRTVFAETAINYQSMEVVTKEPALKVRTKTLLN